MANHPDDFPMDRTWELSHETMNALVARAAERAREHGQDLPAWPPVDRPLAR